MGLGERIRTRAKELGINHSELARRSKTPQSTVSTIINGDGRWSPHLARIARVLSTTVDYLTGETDDPDVGAPPPLPPVLNHIMMPVALPSENALARMFEGLLEVADRSAPTAELARELAQLLPSGLLQLRGRLTELAPMVPPRRAEVAEALATEDRGRQ